MATNIEFCGDVKSAGYDAIVVVAPNVSAVANADLKAPLKAVVDVDKKAENGVFLVPTSLPAKRIVFSSTGPLDKDFDDVRSFEDAAEKGVSRAIEAGAKKPLVVCHNKDEKSFPNAATVSVLGALKAAYVPIEVREAVPEKSKQVDAIGVFGDDKVKGILERAKALEWGRVVSRDIGGSDPERMAAPRIEEYVRKTFENSGVKVEVIKGQSTFEKEYPCLAAVNRAASSVPRHDGRVIWLTYEPEGPVEKTLMMVGKGITYDTGGADIKAGGIMAGMSRDKCGAADVAGVMKAVSLLKPKNVKVIGAMACVRNSVGEECYVSDEIITSRAGVRIRVGNTDAEVIKEFRLSEASLIKHKVRLYVGSHGHGRRACPHEGEGSEGGEPAPDDDRHPDRPRGGLLWRLHRRHGQRARQEGAVRAEAAGHRRPLRRHV